MTGDAPRDPSSGPIEISRQLTGDQELGDQQAFIREGELDEADRVTDTEVYEGSDPADLEGALESLTIDDLRAGETDDPTVAAQEGLAWIPPTDPPLATSADDPQGAAVAAGFGSSALDEPYDFDHRSELPDQEGDMAARVREALRADAATNRYADEIAIGAVGNRVALRGVVDDIEDSDNLLDVAGRVEGVDEVIDELEISSLG